MKKIFNLLVVSFMFTLTFISVSSPAYAAGGCGPGTGALSVPTWYKYVPLDSDCNVNKDSSVIQGKEGRLAILVLFGLFDIVLFIAGLVAVLIIVYAGFRFLTSAGEPQKIAAARTTILNALVGLAITLIASRAVSFIAGNLFK